MVALTPNPALVEQRKDEFERFLQDYQSEMNAAQSAMLVKGWSEADKNKDGRITTAAEYTSGTKNELALQGEVAREIRANWEQTCYNGNDHTAELISEAIKAKNTSIHIEKALASVEQEPSVDDLLTLAKLKLGPDPYYMDRGVLTKAEIAELENYAVQRMALVLDDHRRDILANPQLREAIIKEYPDIALTEQPEPADICSGLGFRFRNISGRST